MDVVGKYYGGVVFLLWVFYFLFFGCYMEVYYESVNWEYLGKWFILLLFVYNFIIFVIVEMEWNF